MQRSERALGIPSSVKREKTEVKVSDNGKVMVIKTDYSANGSKASVITLLAENDGQLDWAAQSFVDGKPTSELKYDYTLSHDDMMEMFDDNGAIRQDINPLKQIARNAGIDIDALLNGKEHGTKVSIEASREKTSENEGGKPLSAQIEDASAEVNTDPTEAQKEAGNYKKGHVQVGSFDITIEQPQGSVRKGTDANGKQWESKMHNTYGYFRGTEGVDGDHIDVFLSNDIDGWNRQTVFVVDQYNPDGSFDEHKVMLGFNNAEEAKREYLANYEKGWENGRRIDVSAVNLADFEKWIASSHRKTKPFSEYSSVKKEGSSSSETKQSKSTAEEKPFNAVIEMLRKKFPDASMEALTAADRLLREQALPGERQKAIEAVAKALGLKVEWRDTMEKENGTFNPKTRTITIARDSEHALANTFGHEVTHAVREISEADYKNLKDAVRRLYSSEKEYNEAVQAYGDMYTGLDFDALEEELIADNIGFMIGGRNDMTQELASRMNHRVLWAIHDAMNKVRNSLAKVLHIDSKKNGLLEALDSAKATIRETMANAQRIAKEKGQGLSNESGSARQSLRMQDTAIRDAQTKPSAGPREAERMEIKQSLRDGTFIQSGSYFSGGGLLEEGLKNYLDPKVAVEFNSKISGVYADNHGRHIVTADVRDVDPATLVGQLDNPVKYSHASPVCKNFSRAKREAGEVELDKETARSTADFIKANHPKVVTIENVKGYRDSEALKIITDELSRQGYDWDMDVYNAADFGGYTSRERLIVRAVRDGVLPPKPKAIAKEDRKKGWMEAVSDLIPTLHEKRSGVPEWMDSRLKAEGIDWHNIDKPLYVFGQGNNRNSVPHTFADELLPTLRTKGGDVIIMPDGRVLRAEPRVLARVTGLSDDYHMPITDDLAHTIVGNGIPAQLSQGVIGPLLEGVFNGGERVTQDNRQGDDKNMKFSHRTDGEIANKTVSNVIISSEDKVPQTRDKALSLLSTLEQPFKNKDQGVDIYVSKRDARHSMSFRNIDQIKAMSKIDKIAEEAVKIGEVPVEDDEKETTKAISIYYCPVNVAGKQYSARLTVKTYFEGSNVIDEMHLYNYQLRNMAPFAQSVSQQVLPTHPNGTISEYKVSDLIHDTQQNDLKMVGLENDSEKQSRRGTPNLNPDHIAQAIYEQSVSCFKFDLDEAWHDSLLSVKRLQEAISETRGVPIRDFENAYWHAVALSSVNAAEMEQLMNLRIQPFIEAVQDICKKHDLTQEAKEVNKLRMLLGAVKKHQPRTLEEIRQMVFRKN